MTSREGDAQARSTADAVARRSYGKLVAFLAARTRDVAAAEDALSEAFAAALADWPVKGCPANPEAFSMRNFCWWESACVQLARYGGPRKRKMGRLLLSLHS